MPLGCGDDGDGSASGTAATTATTAPGGDGDGDDSDSGPATTGPADSTTGSDETTGAATDDTAGDSEGQPFVTEPDGGTVAECDVWSQDCPDGQKCMPWANDGGNSWNATTCTELDADPAQPGDTCTVVGSSVSGVDNCDVSSMCWNVDENNVGTCAPFCTGTADTPMCEDPGDICSITNEGVLILCLPVCDPVLQDCAEGEGCYPDLEAFTCAPDYSGEAGAYGDPCEYIGVCNPGLFCAFPEEVPGCTGSTGCCSEFCDLADPAGDAQCMGQAEGQLCQAWYEEGTAPPGGENVGFCGIPL